MLNSTDSSDGKLLAGLCLLYIAAVLIVQLTILGDPSYLHEMQRALFTYHRVRDPELFPQDYIAHFINAFPRPFLYEWMTRLWLWAGGDLIILHRALPIACWLVFLAGVAEAARHLGDRIVTLGAVAVAIAQPVYLYQIAGASAHSFAFPLFIWGFVGLVRGSARGLALLTVVSGLLYPAATPVLGLLLAWQVFVAGGVFGGTNRDRLKAVLLVGLVAAVSLGLLLHSLGLPRDLGEPLVPLEQVDLYPENGPRGSYLSGVFNPPLFVLGKVLAQLRTQEPVVLLSFLLGVGGLAVYGFLALPRGSAWRRAMAGFILCSLAALLVVYLVKPHHSYRLILYPLSTVLPLLFVVGVKALWSRRGHFTRFANALTVATLAVTLAGFDSLNAEKYGYWIHLEQDDRAVLDFAAAQPSDTLFAIWPRGGSAVEFIPYLAQRPLLVMIKAHFPTHDRHVLVMRERTNALIDAYLATDEAPLQALGCHWGVDYLVVDKTHFSDEDRRPRYFEPFNARIDAIWRSHRRDEFLLSDPDPASVALENDRYVVLRLPAARAGAAGPCAAGQGSIEAAGPPL